MIDRFLREAIQTIRSIVRLTTREFTSLFSFEDRPVPIRSYPEVIAS
jgi:hypothetical protein